VATPDAYSIKRKSFATILPRVDNSITDLGKSLAKAMKPVVHWGKQNEAKVKHYQKIYDSAAD
jgi:DNA-binding HxlR family transcriptional regulator